MYGLHENRFENIHMKLANVGGKYTTYICIMTRQVSRVDCIPAKKGQINLCGRRSSRKSAAVSENHHRDNHAYKLITTDMKSLLKKSEKAFE